MGGDICITTERHEKLRFPGASGSPECAGWKLLKGAVAEQRRTTEKNGVPELPLKLVADDRLWIWHLVFGYHGATSDIKVLDCSSFYGLGRDMARAYTAYDHCGQGGGLVVLGRQRYLTFLQNLLKYHLSAEDEERRVRCKVSGGFSKVHRARFRRAVQSLAYNSTFIKTVAHSTHELHRAGDHVQHYS